MTEEEQNELSMTTLVLKDIIAMFIIIFSFMTIITQSASDSILNKYKRFGEKTSAIVTSVDGFGYFNIPGIYHLDYTYIVNSRSYSNTINLVGTTMKKGDTADLYYFSDDPKLARIDLNDHVVKYVFCGVSLIFGCALLGMHHKRRTRQTYD